MYNYFPFTDNKGMNVALTAVGAAVFALLIFPVHLYNYIYINTGQKYASLNVGTFGWNFFNVNTVKDHPNEMQVNGKNKKLDMKKLKGSYYKIFNCICLYKMVQLGDYGMQREGNAYAALAQNCLTTAIYKFVQINGNFCKLRNYTILNQEHSDIRYYAKTVTVINALVVLKIFIIILMEKLNDKNKKKQRK